MRRYQLLDYFTVVCLFKVRLLRQAAQTLGDVAELQQRATTRTKLNSLSDCKASCCACSDTSSPLLRRAAAYPISAEQVGSYSASSLPI